MKIEKRYAGLSSEKGQAKGYCVLWDKPSFIPQLGRKELFKKGSLKIPPQGVSCLFQHKEDHLLGNTKSDTLRIKSDSKGLYFECDIPESQTKIRESLKRKDIQGASVAFHCKEQNYNGGTREVLDATLTELSLVSTPCHESPITYRNQKKPKPRVKWGNLLCGY